MAEIVNFFISSAENLLNETVDEKNQAFECNICGKKFGFKFHLSEHENSVHKKIKAFEFSDQILGI